MLAALLHTNIEAQRSVEIARLLPMLTSQIDVADGFIEQSVGANRVGEVEKLCIQTVAIDFQSFFIERSSFGVFRFIQKHIRDVANGMSVCKVILFLAENLSRLGVMSAGGGEVMFGAGSLTLGDRFGSTGHRNFRSLSLVLISGGNRRSVLNTHGSSVNGKALSERVEVLLPAGAG